MEFTTDVFSLRAPRKSSFSLGNATLPNSTDIYFRSKQEEIVEQYGTARIFMHQTETDKWDYWFNPLEDDDLQKAFQYKLIASFYETALMFYNIVIDLSWTMCYVSAEFACTAKGQRMTFGGMMPIEDAYNLLRNAEKNVTTPTAQENPFAYLKIMRPEFSTAIDLIVEFWNNFSDTPIRNTYNYCKHKGKPAYEEIEALRGPRFMGLYIKKTEGDMMQFPSDISDVQMKLSLEEEIQRLRVFDDERLFPYLQNLIIALEAAINPTPFLLT